MVDLESEEITTADTSGANIDRGSMGLAWSPELQQFDASILAAERAVGRFMFFVSAEEREDWIQELEQYARGRP